MGTVAVATLATLVSAPIMVNKYQKISPYLASDVSSELTRQPTQRKPTAGLKGAFITLEEHAKTARDYFLFTINDLIDPKPEYDIFVDKTTNQMEVYLDGKFVRRVQVGTGQILKSNKSAFGEYVTPDGDYMIINVFDRQGLQHKFGKNAYLYGEGMIQLAGPWAPYIALHGTYDDSKISGYTTNGCINMRNGDLRWIMENVGIGSRVHVSQSKPQTKS